MGSFSSAKTASFIVGFLAHYGILVTCGVPYWKTSNWQSSDGLYGRIPTFDGIWWHCMSLKTGGFSCNNYGKPSIYTSSDIQACRALMCVACIFSFSALLLSLMGLDCTTMIAPETKSKNRISMFAGMGFLVAGVSCGAAVSWFAWKVTFEYYNPMYQSREFKYEYGACLYIGWVSMLLALIAGIMLVVGACKNMKSENNDTYYPATTYQPVSSKTTKLGRDKTEYV